MTIRAVLFDIGGVLFRIVDPTPHRRWAERLGLSVAQFTETVYGSPVSLRATVGQATAEAIWEDVGRRFSLSPADVAALRADFLSGGVWDEELLAFIRSLRPQYRTGTISDAWPDAREAVAAYVNDGTFDVIVFSGEEGVRKPDPEIYSRALSRLGIVPGEAIFCDDRLKNVRGAQSVGMHAFQLVDSTHARQEIERLLDT